MDIQNFIDEFKKTFIYDILCESLEDEQLFEHTIVGNQVIWMKEQTRQMWFMWQQAQKVAVPEGFVLINKESLAFHARSIRMFNSGEHYKEEIEEHVCSIEAMIEAQELTHD